MNVMCDFSECFRQHLFFIFFFQITRNLFANFSVFTNMFVPNEERVRLLFILLYDFLTSKKKLDFEELEAVVTVKPTTTTTTTSDLS